jgi:hypothetical protein
MIADTGSVELESHIPKVVGRLLNRIKKEPFQKIALYGFGENMKWLFRLLKEEGKNPLLCDFRKNFIGYDCGGEKVISVDDLQNDSNTLVVSCLEEIGELKASFRYIIEKKFHNLPVIYDRSQPHQSFRQEYPYKQIADKARARAVSMISDDQLFDLIQFIRATKDIPGDVVEYGSLHGGSGAVLAEAVNFYNDGNKPVWLFDTFAGIPKSRYGLDHRWNGAFSNNSFSAVTNAFKDCPNVKVVQGNICETYSQVKNPISFGYLASDTMETGEILLNFMWEKLSPGGIICVCDYGSYPNCIPLTVMTDLFLENRKDAIVFQPLRVGIFMMKKKS